jgi:two-component system response regulator FixJ
MKGILTRLRMKFASTAQTDESVQSSKSSDTNVLVVDDDNAVCRIVQRMLSDQHYQVQTSQSVADAILAIEQKSFDAYVIDCKLLDGSGLDVAERIRSKGSEAPIILMSGYDASSVTSRAEKFSISDFLQKPFSRETICNAVKKAIGSPEVALAWFVRGRSQPFREAPVTGRNDKLARTNREGWKQGPNFHTPVVSFWMPTGPLDPDSRHPESRPINRQEKGSRSSQPLPPKRTIDVGNSSPS